MLLLLAAPGREVQPTAAARDSLPPDTIQATASIDTPFITLLPEQVGGRPASAYRLLRGPALSGVAGRSITWVPRSADAGATRLLVLRTVPPADTLAPDTLVVRIDVSS